MRNKVWLVVLFLAGILVGLGATTVFAQGPTTTTQSNNSTWQQMYQACANGDYQTMAKLHDQYCGGPNGMMSGNWTGGMMGPNGTMGPNGMMGNWQGGSYTPQYAPGYGGGMMGDGRGGMMGGWYR